ncbi:MAG: hypothetical protein GY798_15490 [Hyphomicrobiales bacterium]|nr:hypothetical protein [Hyphomicrobiales bacterium]
MTKADDIRWFKEQFQKKINKAAKGSLFDVDMLVAVACQETGEIWPVLRRKGLPVDEILRLCVGDTLDEDKGRRAFPRTKAALVAKPNGQEMFEIAHQALVNMAVHIPGYRGVAARPAKFCHGFGVFQLDLQFFLEDPQYFLKKRYEKFDQTLGKCLAELQSALKKVGYHTKSALTDLEFAHVAIAYNTGGFKPSKGLKQGHFNGTRFYGEQVFSFVQLSRTVAMAGATPQIPPPPDGGAIVPAPTPVPSGGKRFVVDTRLDTLRMREEPKIGFPPFKNVIAQLPDGHPVRAVSGTKRNSFLEVETSLSGAHLRGFVKAKFLKPAPAQTHIPIVIPDAEPPTEGIVAINMPRKQGTVTKRTGVAGAHSLNETGQPGRKGTAPTELTAALAKIIDWLAVDKTSHKRYQPRSGLTFCNIYAHDYCHLAGAYLPRVWWSEKALLKLDKGETVKPLYGDTIREMRANDLFRWLRDFGPRFGWRQSGNLTELQQVANEGGPGVIVARRKQDGRSGHIVMVVPEISEHTARRNGASQVVAPLQSQAGSTNFRYSRGKTDWWLEDRFAESAFWVRS